MSADKPETGAITVDMEAHRKFREWLNTHQDMPEDSILRFTEAGEIYFSAPASEIAAEIQRLETKLEAVRKYADERAWYAAKNRSVSSYRIASDLFRILGLGPDGKGPASDGQPQSEG